MENPGSRVISREADREITTVLDWTAADSIPFNGVDIVVVIIRTSNNPELMLQKISSYNS